MFDRERTQVRFLTPSRARRPHPSPSTAEERLAPGAAILVIGAFGAWFLGFGHRDRDDAGLSPLTGLGLLRYGGGHRQALVSQIC
jgi:hypothetical protein